MNGLKHSSGPWAVHPASAQVDAFTSSGALPVCQLLWPTEERSEEETFANGRLIAAAPDMLTELRQCAIELEEAANLLRPTFHGMASLYEGAAKRVRATIAKTCPPADTE